MDLADELHEKLTGLRPVLEHQGVVQQRRGKGRPANWRLRYRAEDADGIVRHKSLKLPDAAAAEVVRNWISAWRDERERREERDCLALRHEKQQLLKRRKLRREVIKLAGGSKRRRRIGRAFDEAAAKGPDALSRFVISRPWEAPSPKGGRPRKRSALW